MRTSSCTLPALCGRLVPALSDRSRDTAPSPQAAAVPRSVCALAQALVPALYLCRACPMPWAAHLPPPPSGHHHSSHSSAQPWPEPPPSPALPLEQSTGRQPAPTPRVLPCHPGTEPCTHRVVQQAPVQLWVAGDKFLHSFSQASTVPFWP